MPVVLTKTAKNAFVLFAEPLQEKHTYTFSFLATLFFASKKKVESSGEVA
jgi:hypothetical protein